MIDPIADMLAAIRNAQAVSQPTVSVPFSQIKYEIAKILGKQGFFEGVTKIGRKTKKTMKITLKYQDKIPAISGLKRISKPRQRIYVVSRKIPRVKGGYGIAIISTSRGLMTNKEARKQKLGGEVICKVW